MRSGRTWRVLREELDLSAHLSEAPPHLPRRTAESATQSDGLLPRPPSPTYEARRVKSGAELEVAALMAACVVPEDGVNPNPRVVPEDDAMCGCGGRRAKTA